MKQRASFWRSIERYGWRAIERIAPLLPALVITTIVLTMIVSFTSQKTSVASLHSLTEVVEKAARIGDYALAQKLDREVKGLTTNEVLGVNSELEDLIYPERLVLREIERYKQLLALYPGHRDIYLTLAELYEQVSEYEAANEYWELARTLDPNNIIFN